MAPVTDPRIDAAVDLVHLILAPYPPSMAQPHTVVSLPYRSLVERALARRGSCAEDRGVKRAYRILESEVTRRANSLWRCKEGEMEQ